MSAPKVTFLSDALTNACDITGPAMTLIEIAINKIESLRPNGPHLETAKPAAIALLEQALNILADSIYADDAARRAAS